MAFDPRYPPKLDVGPVPLTIITSSATKTYGQGTPGQVSHLHARIREVHGNDHLQRIATCTVTVESCVKVPATDSASFNGGNDHKDLTGTGDV
jgi:hypothetical protein